MSTSRRRQGSRSTRTASRGGPATTKSRPRSSTKWTTFSSGRGCAEFSMTSAPSSSGPPSQSGTSSARSSSRSAAASSFDLRNVRSVLRYLEDLSAFDHRRHHLTHPTSDPSRLQRRSAGSALLNDGSLRRSMRNRTATRREDRRHRPTHLPDVPPRGKAIGRSRLRSAGSWPGFCHGRRSSRRSHGLPSHAMLGH